MSAHHPDVERTDQLSPAEVAAVFRLAGAAGDADGAYPLSEHTALHLRHGGDRPAVHLLIRDGADIAGYAHVDTTDAVDGAAAELVVHPLRRRHGFGRALVTAAIAVATERDPAGRLRLWSHGDHPSASALALSLGFTRVRALWQMRRSLHTPVPEPVVADGVALRAFRPGADDEAWLSVNARAFAHHPEQGRWTHDDLRTRMAEPWFDPAGFLLAVNVADDALLGFHWTKVHGARDGHQHDALGEVYVLGVDPAAQGMGLGRTLTLAGLRHLREQGLSQVMLYVDEANHAATTLYTALGFARWATDVSYSRDR
ncbi:mycothiol synthase [Luedemannella flava]|uniref:Mycothiol acetyltransferase n=1 Tax=Luedemannella flava TaxID=349316 RepID=A0ABP4YJ26_9ACTN